MVSVCIATYNGADVILTQIRSILPQLQETDELIVSDDGSTDGTVELVKGLNDRRIRLLHGPAKGSPIPNFEYALSMAKGDYIFLSDQDDCWMEGKVEASLKALNQGYELVVTDCLVTDKHLNVFSDSFFALNRTREGKYYNLFLKNGYLGGCMAFTRRLRDASLPFPKHIPMHDIWIGNVAGFYFNVHFIHQPFSYFRRTGNNVSTTAAKSKNNIFKKVLFRLRKSYYLLRIHSHVRQVIQRESVKG